MDFFSIFLKDPKFFRRFAPKTRGYFEGYPLIISIMLFYSFSRPEKYRKYFFTQANLLMAFSFHFLDFEVFNFVIQNALLLKFWSGVHLNIWFTLLFGKNQIFFSWPQHFSKRASWIIKLGYPKTPNRRLPLRKCF